MCGSYRKNNSYKVLNDIKGENEEIISFTNKDIKFCSVFLEDNKEEISDIINWFKGVSECFPFEFEFLYYFLSENSFSICNEYDNYEGIINNIKNKIFI